MLQPIQQFLDLPLALMSRETSSLLSVALEHPREKTHQLRRKTTSASCRSPSSALRRKKYALPFPYEVVMCDDLQLSNFVIV